MFYSIKNIILSIAISTLALNAFAAENLVFAFDIIRHGDRTPLLIIPQAPDASSEELGQLTARGMRQELQRGDSLRKKYIEQYHLLPEHFQNNTMYAYSTDTDRTLMSAQALLLGFYTLGTGPRLSTGQPALPLQFQPIPIHTQPKSSDPSIIDADKEKYNQEINQLMMTQPSWIQKTNELKKEKFDLWSKATGVSINDLDDLDLLADTFYIYELHHTSFPETLTHTQIQEIIKTGFWVFITKYQTKEIASLIASPLLLKIAHYLNDAYKQKTPLKWVLFSAHDNTISSVMTMLGAPLNKKPPYASDLNFSLFKTDQNSYIVRVSYNDKPVNIPACGGTSCTLEQFINLTGYRTQNDSQ